MTTDIDPAFADRCAATAIGLRQLAELGASPNADEGSLALAARVTAELLTDPQALLAVALVIEQQRGTHRPGRLTLHPDPGTGHHWRLTLEVNDVELSSDVAPRDEPALALQVAGRVAESLGLTANGPDRWADDGGAS